MNTKSGKSDILSKERLEAAHQIYEEMVSDPSLKFDKSRKEEILSHYRSCPASCSSSSKNNLTTKQNVGECRVKSGTKKFFNDMLDYSSRKNPKSGKNRKSLYEPKHPVPQETGKQRDFMNSGQAKYASIVSGEDPLELFRRRREAELLQFRQKEEKLWKQVEFRKKDIARQVRTQKHRQKLTRDLELIKKFERDAIIERMKVPAKDYPISTTYLVELRFLENSKQGNKYLTTADTPLPREQIPQPHNDSTSVFD